VVQTRDTDNKLNFLGNGLQRVKQSLGKLRKRCENGIKIDLTQRGCADETRGELDQGLV
jgi:hypothetical protein